MTKPLPLLIALILSLVLVGCGPVEIEDDTPELSARKASEEFNIAGNYYGAYLERYYEFPELAEKISEEELALVGYSYGQCLAELAGELVSDGADQAGRARAANYYEMAGNAFNIAAGTKLEAYKQPSLYSTVLVYNQAVELDGEARGDLIDTTLRACESYFAAKNEEPSLFKLPDDDAVVALIKTQLLYRRGRDEEARAFFEEYLNEYGRDKGGDWPIILVGRLGDETFQAGLYDHAEEFYRRAAGMAADNDKLLGRYQHNTRIADFHEGLLLEAAVPKRRYDLLTAEEQANLRRALEHYDEVAERYPGDEVAGRAVYRRAYLEEMWMLDYAAAARTYTRVFTETTDHPLAATACFRAGLCSEQAGDYDEARRFYERLDDDYDDSPEAPLIELREGIMGLEAAGYRGDDAEDAAERIEDFIDDHAGEDAYRLWVGEGYASLGHLAEQGGDDEAALELYTKAVEQHGFREGVRYGSERIARAYEVYADHHWEEFQGVEVGGSLEEVQEEIVRVSELRNKTLFGYSGADAYGDLQTSARAKYMAGRTLETYATMLQDVEITSGGTPEELDEIYAQINYPTNSFFIQAQQAYRAAVETARLAGGDSATLERAQQAYDRLTRIIGES